MSVSLSNAPTPLARVVRLLNEGLSLLAENDSARKPLEEALAVAAGLDAYVETSSSRLIVPVSHSVSEPEVHAVYDDLLATTEALDWSRLFKEGKTNWELTSAMCAGEWEASFVQQVALDLKASSILEIGLFTGTTTLAVALLPDVKKVVALDIEPFLEELDRPYWERAGVSSKIETVIGPASESLRKLKDQGLSFDLAFIDADKPSYLTYVNLLLELNLLSPRGLILADNTIYKGYTFASADTHVSPSANLKTNNKSAEEATGGIKKFNEAVRANPNLHVTMLPIRDGVTMIRRKI